MTPNDIDVLLHCYCCPSPHPRAHAPAVIESIERFLKQMLIYKAVGEDFYRTTDRGDAHIKQLCHLPLPTKQWVDKDGEVLDEHYKR